MKHTDTGTIPMFPEPEPVKIRKRGFSYGCWSPFARYPLGAVRVLVDDTPGVLPDERRVLAEAKGDAPVSLPGTVDQRGLPLAFAVRGRRSLRWRGGGNPCAPTGNARRAATGK